MSAKEKLNPSEVLERDHSAFSKLLGKGFGYSGTFEILGLKSFLESCNNRIIDEEKATLLLVSDVMAVELIVECVPNRPSQLSTVNVSFRHQVSVESLKPRQLGSLRVLISGVDEFSTRLVGDSAELVFKKGAETLRVGSNGEVDYENDDSGIFFSYPGFIFHESSEE